MQGNWEIVSITQVMSDSRDSLYYDLEKDSIHIPAADLKEAYKDGHDSLFTVQLFKKMYTPFEGSVFSFRNDSVTCKTRTAVAQGTFETRKGNSLEMQLKYDEGVTVNLNYTYWVKEEMLNLIMKIDIGYYKYLFRKK